LRIIVRRKRAGLVSSEMLLEREINSKKSKKKYKGLALRQYIFLINRNLQIYWYESFNYAECLKMFQLIIIFALVPENKKG